MAPPGDEINIVPAASSFAKENMKMTAGLLFLEKNKILDYLQVGIPLLGSTTEL